MVNPNLRSKSGKSLFNNFHLDKNERVTNKLATRIFFNY